MLSSRDTKYDTSSRPILPLVRRKFKNSLGLSMESSLPFGKSSSHRNFILSNWSPVISSAISSKKRLNSAFFLPAVSVDSSMTADRSMEQLIVINECEIGCSWKYQCHGVAYA